MRARWIGLMIVVAAGGAFGLLQLVSSSASAAGGAATQRVIVVFRDQDPSQPASGTDLGPREATFRASRAATVSQMAASGARDVHAYNLIDAVSATVSRAEAARLRAEPAVREVVPDGLISMATPNTERTSGSAASSFPIPSSACPPAGEVELDPQALQTISAASSTPGAKTARSLGLTGAGVKVGFIADGVDINDPDFIRANGQHVFVDYKDFSGYGTSSPTGGGEAFLDSSSIAAQGREVYDISDYTGDKLDRPCDIRIEGVAPGASLVGLDVFGPTDGAYDSTFLEAIDYAVTVDHVNVLNESLGSNYYPDDQADLDLIKQANDDAVAAGTTVTVSAGDAGPTSTLGNPATDPHVIDAGASTTYRSYAQTYSGGFGLPGVTGWLNDNISGLSSGGYDQEGRTADIVAPGDLNWALCSTDIAIYADCATSATSGDPYQLTGGTSEAAPLTAGAAAIVIQAYRKTHHGATPSAALVKRFIVSNADDVGMPADQQGAGRLDVYKAALAAEGYGLGASSHGGKAIPTVLDGSTELTVAAAPRTKETLRDTITNPSRHAETFYLRTRAVGAYRTLKQAAVTLSDTTSQHFTQSDGLPSNVERVRFRVPAHLNRLSVSISFSATPGTAYYQVPEISLIDPKGRLAANDIPQGDANFGNSQVTDPTKGTWTAIIFAPNSSNGGYVGNVEVQASAARYTTFGTVTPSRLRLKAGKSAHVVLRTSTAATPGDTSGAIVLSARRGKSGSDDAGNEAGPNTVETIPVAVRTVVPSGKQTFTDSTAGGNGRDPETGQTFYYELNVPSKSPELSATVTLPDTGTNLFQAWLVDPAGEAEAYGTNVYVANAYSSKPGPATDLPGAALHALKPDGGRWTLIVTFAPTASGTQLSQQFSVATSERVVKAGAGGLPDSKSVLLTAGAAHTFDVTVRNTGSAPAYFFADARRPGSTTESLTSLTGASTSVPLGDTSSIPTYLVPTDSTALEGRASTSGSEPIQFDMSPAAVDYGEMGDPDVESTDGTSIAASVDGSPVAQGPWDIAPDIHGVFGASGTSSETATTSLTVTTRPFDPEVTSSLGDLEADGTNTASLPSFNPVLVAPGRTAHIPVTITPTGAAGSQDRGTLYIDEYYDSAFDSLIDPWGDQVAELPYRFTTAG